MICSICPHFCYLDEGETGKCLVRKCVNGVITAQSDISTLAVEPIEKRPFFHYLPGSKWLSVGFYGCSFSCSFCQNYTVSQVASGKSKKMSPAELVELMRAKNATGLVFTYNEPTVHLEYLRELGQVLSEDLHGFPITMKTNGFATEDTWEELVRIVSAFNVDIKGDDDEYQRICGGRLKPVLNSIGYLSGDSLVEVSYLVLPRLLHNKDFHRYIRDYLASISPIKPVHLLYYYPFHNMNEPAYAPEDLIPIWEIFKEKMKYVYISNTFRSEVVKYRNTVCSSCGSVTVDRTGPAKVVKVRCCNQTYPFSE